jgi:hypothetical protein
MNPPLIARGIVAAVAPPPDYDGVIGDLQEEFVQRAQREGVQEAERWYWSQTMRSIPALLSYTRERSSPSDVLVIPIFILLMIVALLTTNEVLDNIIHSIFRMSSAGVTWPSFVAGWLDAAAFGCIVAAVHTAKGIRLVLACAVSLIAFIALPILFGTSATLSFTAWMLILGGAIWMVAAGAAYVVARRLLILEKTRYLD